MALDKWSSILSLVAYCEVLRRGCAELIVAFHLWDNSKSWSETGTEFHFSVISFCRRLTSAPIAVQALVVVKLSYCVGLLISYIHFFDYLIWKYREIAYQFPKTRGDACTCQHIGTCPGCTPPLVQCQLGRAPTPTPPCPTVSTQNKWA